MTWKSRLIAPLPPTVDPANPRVLDWRVTRLEEIAEHHQHSKLDRPHMPDPSWLPVVGVALALILGLTGLASPAEMKSLIRLFVHLP